MDNVYTFLYKTECAHCCATSIIELHTGFTARFPWSIDSYFDSLLIGCHLGRICAHGDCQVEAFT